MALKIQDLGLLSDRTEKKIIDSQYNIMGKSRYIKGFIESLFITNRWIDTKELNRGFYKITKSDRNRILRKLMVELKKEFSRYYNKVISKYLDNKIKIEEIKQITNENFSKW